MYGMSQQLPDRSIVDLMCRGFLDTAMKVAPFVAK